MSRRRLSQRERFWRWVPMTLVEYPLEAALSAWGVIVSPPILLDLVDPPSLAAVFPPWLYLAWAVAMLLSAVTIAVGLWQRRYASSVATGLVLLASVCQIYGLSIIIYNRWGGLPAGGLLVVLGALCQLRAGWLRRRGEILLAIHRESTR